jgi:hypothetical protein
MKGFEMKRTNQKLIALGVGGTIAAALVVIQPLSASSAAAPTLSVTTTQSETAALYSGQSVNFAVQVKNVGTDQTEITGVTSTSTDLELACRELIGRILLPEETVSCSQESVQISGLPAGKFQETTTFDAVGIENTKGTFSSTATVSLWWYGRIPGYWKNHPDQWSTEYLPTNFLQDVFVIPNSLLTDGVLDNDSIPGKDTLMSTLTYQGGTTLKGAAQILLRAASAALLNEAYYGKSYPGAPSLENLVARVNVVLASENKAQYIVLAGYFEKWNNGVRTALS